MPKERSKNSFYESYNDIKVSLSLFRDNWRPFIQTQVLALLVLLIFFIFMALLMVTQTLFMFTRLKTPGPSREIRLKVPLNISPAPRIPFFMSLLPIISFYLTLTAIIVFYIFIMTNFGLARDIIVSGDQFTEFENSFHYFKKNFINYGVMSLLILFSPILLITFFSNIPLLQVYIPVFRISDQESIIGYYKLFFFQYSLLVFFSLSLVNISGERTLKESIKRNFNLLLKYPKRIMTSWIICFLILLLPLMGINLLSIIVSRLALSEFFWFIGILLLVLNISMVSLCYPLISLIATRIHVTTSQNKAL